MTTTTQPLIRWSAFALILSGLIGLGYAVLSPSDNTPGAMLSPLWAPFNVINGLAHALAALGLVGVYLQQAQASGRLGLAAFLIAFFGTVATFGASVEKGFFLQDLALRNPAVQTLGDFFPNAPANLQGYLPVLLGGLFLYLVGYVLMGVAIARAGVFSRWAGGLLIAGTVLSFANFFGADWLHVFGYSLFDLALIWLGAALLARPTASTVNLQPQLAK